MLQLLKHHKNPNKFVYDAYCFLMVSSVMQLKNEFLEDVDVVVINTEKEQIAKTILTQIRTDRNVKKSLVPIFTNSILSLPKAITIHTEGTLDVSLVGSYIQRVSTIIHRIEKLQTPKFISNELLFQFKILAFCYTRNKVLTPITSRKSSIGYVFPLASLLYKNSEVKMLLENLENITARSFFSKKKQDTIHTCKSCSGNYLNFRESCPKCHSIDVQSHDVVHHFVCAHVAPEKDFRVTDGLECPKCNKALRHIGIDYDKPSKVNTCNSCRHEFQNSDMKALCFDCNTENDLEELHENTIANYSITQQGEHFLTEMKTETLQLQNTSFAVGAMMNVNLFKLLLQQEIIRVKNSKGDSLFAKIYFENEQLQLLTKKAKLALAQEIGGIVKSYLKESDVMSAEAFNNYYILLPDTSEDDLERLENIQYNLSKLLSDNLQEIEQEIDIKIHKIQGTDLLENFKI